MKRFSPAGCAWALAVVLVCSLARNADCLTFKLGGDDGWTDDANIDYDAWLSVYKVKIGDTIRFWNADTTDHSVVEVDKLAYETCGASGKLLESVDTLSPTIYKEITFGQSGQFYYICAIPGHCLKGMKVALQILNKDGTVNQTALTADSNPTASLASTMAGISWSSQLLIVLVATVSVVIAAAS